MKRRYDSFYYLDSYADYKDCSLFTNYYWRSYILPVFNLKS